MKNRILDIAVVDHRLDPIVTELRVFVRVETLAANVEIKGRFTGPRCATRSTIEIAYHLKEFARGDYIELQAVIPEPLFWEPSLPALYAGFVQLWQDGELCDRVDLSHGLRRLQILPTGLKLNGKPFTLRGKVVPATISEEDAILLRKNGINTLLVGQPGASSTADLADRLGFFLLVSGDYDQFVESRHELAARSSTFGWIFNRTDFLLGPCEEEDRPMFYGINSSAQATLPNVDFLCCHENELPWLGDAALPKVVATNDLPDPLPVRSDVIGWIESN